MREQAHEVLRLVNLERLGGDYAGTLSGGQRRLLEFGRVLMTDPKLTLLDEPMAGVNPTLGEQLLEHVVDCAPRAASASCSPSTTSTWSCRTPSASWSWTRAELS